MQGFYQHIAKVFAHLLISLAKNSKSEAYVISVANNQLSTHKTPVSNVDSVLNSLNTNDANNQAACVLYLEKQEVKCIVKQYQKKMHCEISSQYLNNRQFQQPLFSYRFVTSNDQKTELSKGFNQTLNQLLDKKLTPVAPQPKIPQLNDEQINLFQMQHQIDNKKEKSSKEAGPNYKTLGIIVGGFILAMFIALSFAP